MENIITMAATDQGVILNEKHLKPLLLEKICIFDDSGKGVCLQLASVLDSRVSLDIGEPLKFRKNIPGEYRAFLYRYGPGYGNSLYLHRDIVGLFKPTVEKTQPDQMTLTWRAEKLPITFTRNCSFLETEQTELAVQHDSLSRQIESAAINGDLKLLRKTYRKLCNITQTGIDLHEQINAYTPQHFIQDYPELVK